MMKKLESEYANLQELRTMKTKITAKMDRKDQQRKIEQEENEQRNRRLYWARQKNMDFQESTVENQSTEFIERAAAAASSSSSSSSSRSFLTDSGNLKYLRTNLRNCCETSANIYTEVRDIKNMLGVLVPVIIGNFSNYFLFIVKTLFLLQICNAITNEFVVSLRSMVVLIPSRSSLFPSRKAWLCSWATGMGSSGAGRPPLRQCCTSSQQPRQTKNVLRPVWWPSCLPGPTSRTTDGRHLSILY